MLRSGTCCCAIRFSFFATPCGEDYAAARRAIFIILRMLIASR